MVYFTPAEIRTFTGYAYNSFKDAGAAMTETQFDSFITNVIEPFAAKAIHQYCGVKDFQEHEVEDYFNGRGASDDDYEYIELDRCFYPREQPVISIEEVSENTAAVSSIPVWTTRTEQTDEVAGDFKTIEDEFYEITYIRFHSNVPQLGVRNVYIDYYAGYGDSSEEITDLKNIAKLVGQNLLLLKRKVEEGQTIRKFGVKDFAQIFDIVGINDEILTPDITKRLDQYTRYNLGGRMWQ